MAENVIPAVVEEVVGTAASFIRNKFDELSGVSDKVEQIELKLLKIRSAIEESKKYDIDNEPLWEMQQKFIDVAQKGEDVLRTLKSQSTAPDPQSSVQSVMPSNSTVSLIWKMLIYGIVSLRFMAHPHRLADKCYGIAYTSYIVNLVSNEVRDFLEMVRQQKRKRGRRRRYRPYKFLFRLILCYCRAQVSWMRFLFLGMASPVYGESEVKGAGASISAVPNVLLLDVVSFSHKSLLLV